MENRREGIGFAFGLLVGAVIGASVAVILAPQSGQRTRQLLRETAKDMQERASDFAADLKEDYQELVEKGKLSEDDKNAALKRLSWTCNLADYAKVDLIIEAITEDLPSKQALFRRLDELCQAEAILASNTSSFMPSSLASVTSRPERVLVAHYFNPPHLLPLQ